MSNALPLTSVLAAVIGQASSPELESLGKFCAMTLSERSPNRTYTFNYSESKSGQGTITPSGGQLVAHPYRKKSYASKPRANQPWVMLLTHSQSVDRDERGMKIFGVKPTGLGTIANARRPYVILCKTNDDGSKEALLLKLSGAGETEIGKNTPLFSGCNHQVIPSYSPELHVVADPKGDLVKPYTLSEQDCFNVFDQSGISQVEYEAMFGKAKAGVAGAMLTGLLRDGAIDLQSPSPQPPTNHAVPVITNAASMPF